MDVELRSDSGNTVSVVDERATPGWFAIAILGLWVSNQGLAWYGIVSSCRDFSGPGTQFSCIMGAIATVLAYSGTVVKTAQWAGHFVNFMNEEGWKLDIQPALNAFSETFNTTVWYVGIYTPPPLSATSMLSNSTAAGPRHVFGFRTPYGGDMHFTYMGNNSVTGSPMFRFGFGNGLNNNTKTNSTNSGTNSKREAYDQQYFLGGGIDYIAQWAGEGSTIDPINDYIHIYNQVECQMTGANSNQQTAAGSWFQIYDNVRHGTVTAGGVVGPHSGIATARVCIS